MRRVVPVALVAQKDLFAALRDHAEAGVVHSVNDLPRGRGAVKFETLYRLDGSVFPKGVCETLHQLRPVGLRRSVFSLCLLLVHYGLVYYLENDTTILEHRSTFVCSCLPIIKPVRRNRVPEVPETSGIFLKIKNIPFGKKHEMNNDRHESTSVTESDAGTADTLGGRLPLLVPDGMSDAQRALYEYMVGFRLPEARKAGYQAQLATVGSSDPSTLSCAPPRSRGR